MVRSLLTSGIVAATICCVISAAAAAPVLEPYTVYEDFAEGAVGSWSSYPPAQDTAYDPTIWVRPLAAEPADDRALYREITPLDGAVHLHGVRKKYDLFVDSASTLTFRCYYKGYGDAAVPVRLTLGITGTPRAVTRDGERLVGWRYDADSDELTLDLPAGTGLLGIR